MRTLVNHGMDVVGGRGIQLGPRNFLAAGYHALPVAITVEGANILTRSLMIFGQGAMRCHPYLFDEMQTLEAKEEHEGLRAFEPLLMSHLGHAGSNFARLLMLGLSGAHFSGVPSGADDFSKRWYQRINHLSAALAICADVALGVLGGDLKRRELLSARLGDLHSQLLIASSLLKFHATQPRSKEADAHAAYALQRSLHLAQEALIAYCANFQPRALGLALRALCLPLGRIYPAPNDAMVRDLGDLIMAPNPVRGTLSERVYLSIDPEDAVGRVESTYQMLLAVEKPFVALQKAWSKGELEADTLDEALQEAVAKQVIRAEDVEPLREYDARRRDCVLTDHFEALL
jgi:acyl-CoA dehydrogenase